jgi:hypothetical protein
VNDWRIPGELRPAEQPEALSVDAKLIAARAALSVVLDATNAEIWRYGRADRKKWPQRNRLEYIRTITDNALRRIR